MRRLRDKKARGEPITIENFVIDTIIIIVIIIIIKFLRPSVNGKHLMPFQSENSVFKFLQGTSVDRTCLCS